MEKRVNIKYTQNFIQKNSLVRQLIAKYSVISSDDLLIEIGGGRGAITFELAKLSKQVISYELDYVIYRALDQKVKDREVSNIVVKNEDFLAANLNEFPKFKVFSNIPFFLTAEIMRKLLVDKSNLESACIFLEEAAAQRFIGQPYEKETLLSLIIKLNWDIKIVYNFKDTDFYPIPNAQVVLVSITKKENNSINKQEFQDFLAFLFNQRKANIKQTLLSLFSFNQIKRIKTSNKLNWEQSARDLQFEQWVEIFKIAKLHLDREKFAALKGSYQILNKNKEKQTKGKELIY